MGELICNGTTVAQLIYNGTTIANKGVIQNIFDSYVNTHGNMATTSTISP